jgi:hypothetical protein
VQRQNVRRDKKSGGTKHPEGQSVRQTQHSWGQNNRKHNIPGTKHPWRQNIYGDKTIMGTKHLFLICMFLDVLSLCTFCPARRLVFRMFCPARCFVPMGVLSRRAFCPAGRFVPPDVLSHGCYVSGCYVAGTFVFGRFAPPDVLSGHLIIRPVSDKVFSVLCLFPFINSGLCHTAPPSHQILVLDPSI